MPQTDYPELTGAKVKMVALYGSYTKGVVVDVNYDIGITIVNEYDNTDYLLCFSGPTIIELEGEEHIWKTIFYSIVAQIKKGEIKQSITNTLFRAFKLNANVDYIPPERCPYNQ